MFRRIVLATTVAVLAGCPDQPAAITDCRAEAQLILQKAAQSRTCRDDSECTLLKFEGLDPCGAPVAASAEPALRQHAVRWRAACKATHADCMGLYVPRCSSGNCTAVLAPGGY